MTTQNSLAILSLLIFALSSFGCFDSDEVPSDGTETTGEYVHPCIEDEESEFDARELRTLFNDEEPNYDSPYLAEGDSALIFALPHEMASACDRKLYLHLQGIEYGGDPTLWVEFVENPPEDPQNISDLNIPGWIASWETPDSEWRIPIYDAQLQAPHGIAIRSYGGPTTVESVTWQCCDQEYEWQEDSLPNGQLMLPSPGHPNQLVPLAVRW